MEAQPSSSNILSVLRLLIRGKLPVERVAGKRWGWLEDALEYAEFSGLVIVELPGGELARLLYHQGALVYLAWKEHSPSEVAAKIQQTALQATFSVYPFDEARQTLALAAVDGVIMQVDEPLKAPYSELRKEFQRRHFSGVLALEDRAILHITLFQDGVIRLATEPPAGFKPTRQILIAWIQQTPATLNLNLRPSMPWPSSKPGTRTQADHEAIWNLVHRVLEAQLGFQAGSVEMRLRRELYHLEADELIENLVAWLTRNKHPDIARELHQALGRIRYRAFYEHFE